MQSSLWKLGALLGVVGVGFLVLLKAQHDMADKKSPPEAFNELSAIDELGELDHSASADEQASSGEHASSEADGPAALAEAYADVQPAVRTKAVPTPAEPVPASEPITATIAAAESEQSVNPFADFAESPTPAQNDGPTPTEQADAAPPADESPNPFGALVESFPNDAADKATEAADDTVTMTGETVDEIKTAAVPAIHDVPEAFNRETIEDVQEAVADAKEAVVATVVAAAEEFDPFDAGDEPAAEPTAPEASTETASTETASAEESATNAYEPTSLTALPPADAGPALMAPAPSSENPSLPIQAEPAHYEIEAAEAQAADEIAQVSGEQPAEGSSSPNPFMVFPGDDQPAQPAPARHTPAPKPQFPGVDAQPAGRAWVGDSASPGDSADRKTHSDGTVEMTIMPRNGEPLKSTHGFQETPDVNPFATGPQPSARQQSAPQPRPNSPGEPTPLERAPSRSANASQPQFPDPGLSFSKGPIQPLAAETPAETPVKGNGLTSADFVGVGTISPDTPSTPQQAQLTIEKQAPSDAALGKELIYSILVKNIGRSPAKNVVVEDFVPKGTELQGTDPQAQMTPEKKLVWQLGSMSPGASRTIRIKVIPTQAGQIGSVATVSFEAAVASRTVITAPELRLALTGPQEVRVGEKAPYKFTLTNAGSADASNVYIRNIIPAGFEHPAAQKRNGVTDIEYEVGTLRRGESREVELTLLAVEEGQFQNHAILTADGNVNVESQQPVHVITSRLKIHRDGPANRVVGSEARFTNTISNESNRPLQGVTIIETIPAGVKFVQASDGGYYNDQQRNVTWQINTLEPGGVRRLKTIVLAEQSGQLASTITAVDQQGDKADAASKLNVAGYSSLTVDVTNPARAIPVGEEVALRLKVRNGGTAAANKVETRVKLPPQLKFVSAHGPVRYAQQGEWITFEPIDRIDVQGEQTFDIVLSATSASQDARVEVQLTSKELTRPLSEDESVVIYADGP